MEGGPFHPGQLAHLWRRLRHFLATQRQGGFTVIEVLIVLAVTGALFVSAVVLIAGRQNRTAFEQAVRSIQTQIEAIVNEVATGYYPNSANFQCTATSSGPQITTVPAGTVKQGTNSDCIFIGKVIQFDVAGTDPEEFVVYTLAGLRKKFGADTEAVNRVESQPKVVAPSTSQMGVLDASVSGRLESGLTTYRMWYDNGGGNQYIGAVGFMASLAKYSGGNIISGSQTLNTIAVAGTELDRDKLTTAQAINDNFPSSPYDTTGGISICFVSGGTDQSALLTIGGNNRNQAIKVNIKSNKTCS